MVVGKNKTNGGKIMQEGWKKAGGVFIAATVVFGISLFFSLQFYYFTDYGGEYSIAEECGDWDDYYCHNIEQEKYSLLGGGLIAAGLAVVCFTRRDEINQGLAQFMQSNVGEAGQGEQGSNPLQPAPITIEINKEE